MRNGTATQLNCKVLNYPAPKQAPENKSKTTRLVYATKKQFIN